MSTSACLAGVPVAGRCSHVISRLTPRQTAGVPGVPGPGDRAGGVVHRGSRGECGTGGPWALDRAGERRCHDAAKQGRAWPGITLSAVRRWLAGGIVAAAILG